MKQGNDLLTTWTQTQQKLWESLAAALSNSRSAEGQELVKAAHRGGLAAWEAAVNQSLRAQETWLEQWFRNASMTNPELSRAAEQLQEIMRCWVSTQGQLWENWFELLRTHSSTAEQGAEEAMAMAESLPMPPPMMPPAPAPEVSEAAPAAEAPVPTAEAPEPAAEAAPVTEEPAPAAEAPEPTAETAPAAEEPAPTAEPAPSVSADDLKVIKGIGPALEKKLHNAGIHSFRQLAQISADEVERVEATLHLPGRMYRDDWIGQARNAHREKYGEDV